MADEIVNMSGNDGFNYTGTALSVAKQYLMECEGSGTVTLNKETLKLILMEFIGTWKNQQQLASNAYPKVKTNA